MSRLPVPASEIHWLTDRLHTATRNSDVVRHFRRRMYSTAWTRANRKAVYRVALARHAENRGVALAVATGRFAAREG